jgi:hypothetical protein
MAFNFWFKSAQATFGHAKSEIPHGYEDQNGTERDLVP